MVTGSSLAGLRRLTRRREPGERCDLCGAPIPAEHRHLFEPATRKLVCGCQACSLLFGNRSAGRHRSVPTTVRYLERFQLDDALWDELLVPVNLAFFTHSTMAGRVVALYPSPAGATESQLALEAWAQLAVANPILNSMEPDVEALLVNRVGQARDHFIAPIDECYRLVGLVLTGWRGLSGGSEVWEAVGGLFGELRARAEVVTGA